MTTENFEFSVSRHVVFCAGYLDAVGRVLTTDAELWALTVFETENALEVDQILDVQVHTRTLVENWSREFGWLVDDFLGIDQCDRLGFYLIDYLCWFKEFTENAACSKLDCNPLRIGTVGQVVYLLQLTGGQRVVVLAQHIDKMQIETSEPI